MKYKASFTTTIRSNIIVEASDPIFVRKAVEDKLLELLRSPKALDLLVPSIGYFNIETDVEYYLPS